MENLNLDVKDLIDDPDMQSAELDENKAEQKQDGQGADPVSGMQYHRHRCILRICHSCRWEF